MTEAQESAGLCPHCLADAVTRFPGEHSWEFQGEKFALARCGNCCGAFTRPTPSPDLLKWLYSQGFSYRWYRHHYPAKFVDCLERLVEYRRHGNLRGRLVLDYGGGVGYMARAARIFGLECRTWDPYAGRSPGDVSERKWDTVFCHHTLEHSPRPEQMLKEMRSFMREGSSLILAVPNAEGRGYRERGVEWVWCQPPLLHLHHFTRRGIQSLLERTGFVHLEIRYRDRWDASTLADVRANRVFRFLDASWHRSPLPAATAQLTSLARSIALLGSRFLESRTAPEDRSELLVVAAPAGDSGEAP